MTGRARHLLVAGAVDSVGLALGWAAFNLLAVYKHGLAAVGLLNAAMFVGVALAAPAASWLTSRLDGKRTLQVTAVVEALLRVASLVLLYLDAPLILLLFVVASMNVCAWIGFAAMRVEVDAVDTGATGMTRYLAMTLGLEALGASAAAFLPITRAGSLAPGWLAAVVAAYALSLLPTLVVARGSTVAPRAPVATRSSTRDRWVLFSGAFVMVVASGPTLLFVALAARLHGRQAVAGAAIAFAVGSLLAPMVTARLEQANVGGESSWPLWCLGIVAGWAAAPWSVEGLWLAQLLSGLCLAGFQGEMDHTLAKGRADGQATTVLTQASAARAIGSAVAVRLAPAFVAAGSFAAFAGVAGLLALVGGAVLGGIVRADGHLDSFSTARLRSMPSEETR